MCPFMLTIFVGNCKTLSRSNQDYCLSKLLSFGVRAEVRSLKIGDVLWVAKRYRETISGILPFDFVVSR